MADPGGEPNSEALRLDFDKDSSKGAYSLPVQTYYANWARLARACFVKAASMRRSSIASAV